MSRPVTRPRQPGVPDPAPAPARRAWVEQIMGMPISIHLRGDDVDGLAAHEAVATAFRILREMDSIFSTYRHDSDLMRLRREEVQVSQCSPLVEEALRIGQEAEVLTRGAFTTLLPTGDGDLAFDPTGLVKGWAVDRASVPLLALERISFCINAGGDILIGAHPDMPAAGRRRDRLARRRRGPARPAAGRQHPDAGARGRGDVRDGCPGRPPLRPAVA